MAPIPPDTNMNLNGELKDKHRPYWTKVNIALTAVFAILFLALFLGALSFCLYHRYQKKKQLNKRKSDSAGLLANEDKTSMFSSNRASSVTLYVDSDADARNKRSSTDTMHLVPLQVTPPVEEIRDPIGENNNSNSSNNNNSNNNLVLNTTSSGSGVSSISGQTNTTHLSPISRTAEHFDTDSIRPSGRPRSISTTSGRSRYYERMSIDTDMPSVPKIVHTSWQQ
ncbi:hypothetical protein ACJQWK_05586 [Exserohilum turcicum]|uniref:Uncharacterized protein n=1 Tax=Exserohilum turcicum (strain 28A) TaxID=671987 RepID=R0JLB3_EXST2|nr:uncharacterized protein SETTUDRAFT_165546 [Exserohilum turcica Et28A]EOA82048.1 hypothetical protein SETTUDRAFT_165546 [Exserohilum turcica Et28A]